MEYTIYDFATGECDYCRTINDDNKHLYVREVVDGVASKAKVIVVGTVVHCDISLDGYWHTRRDIDLKGAKLGFLEEQDYVTLEMLRCKHGEKVTAYMRKFRHDYPKYCSRYDGEYTFKRTAFNAFYRAHKPLIVGVVANSEIPTAVVLYRDINNYYLGKIAYNANGMDIHYFGNGIVSEVGVYAIVNGELTTELPQYKITDDGLVPFVNRPFLVAVKPSRKGYYLLNGKIEYTNNVDKADIPCGAFDLSSTSGQFLPSSDCILDCGRDIMGSTMVDLYGNVIKC